MDLGICLLEVSYTQKPDENLEALLKPDNEMCLLWMVAWEDEEKFLDPSFNLFCQSSGLSVM